MSLESFTIVKRIVTKTFTSNKNYSDDYINISNKYII